jgi:hypothetical protein
VGDALALLQLVADKTMKQAVLMQRKNMSE